MTNHELYRELSEAFSTGATSVTSVLEPLGMLAENLSHSDIAKWANKELYGYNADDPSLKSAAYRNLSIYAVGRYCGPHAIPGENPLVSTSEVERLKEQSGFDVLTPKLLAEGFITFETRVHFSSGRIELKTVGHLKAREDHWGEIDISNVKIMYDDLSCLKCLAEVRKRAKDYFHQICQEHESIKVEPITKGQLVGWVIAGIITCVATLFGALGGALLTYKLTDTHKILCADSEKPVVVPNESRLSSNAMSLMDATNSIVLALKPMSNECSKTSTANLPQPAASSQLDSNQIKEKE